MTAAASQMALTLSLTLFLTMSTAASAPHAAPPDSVAQLLTRAEQTDYAETARYQETLDYARRLEKASPWIRVSSFGRSPEGRDLILVVASSDRAFDPAAAAKTGKPVVLIQAGIHAGEIDGKDAGFMLLRDIAVTKRLASLLDHAIILFMPIYNVDGHERFGPYNRINQDGPKEQGWRTTSRNLNLNRDYMKADAVETRAWLKLFNAWWPDLTIDCHVTDGADFRYDVTYAYDAGPNVAPGVAKWLDKVVPQGVAPALERAGHVAAFFIDLKDGTDPAAGYSDFGISTPRFSTGYTVLRNRPSFLIETHMLKDYRTRVMATYDTLKALLDEVGKDHAGLRDAVKQADAEALTPGELVLLAKPSGRVRKEIFRGLEYRREPSEISGVMQVIYGRGPFDIQVERAVGYEASLKVAKPAAYIVPAPWTEVIEVLEAHGLQLQRLKQPATVRVESYRLSEPKWKEAPFEGRHQVTFKTERLPAVAREFVAGSVVVPMNQRGSAVAAGLLEPQAPDSLVGWGFFDAIFEQKEYAEAYILEKLAREMLDKDPALRTEFVKALADPDFAASPTRRLDFFYHRSPWWDPRIGAYPIGLVISTQSLDTEPLP